MAAIDCSFRKGTNLGYIFNFDSNKTEWFLHILTARETVSDILQIIDCQIAFCKYIAPTNNRDTRPAQRLD